MTKGELIQMLKPFTDDLLIVTRNEGDGSDNERTFSRGEYHWDRKTSAKMVLIINPSILGLNA